MRQEFRLLAFLSEKLSKLQFFKTLNKKKMFLRDDLSSSYISLD